MQVLYLYLSTLTQAGLRAKLNVLNPVHAPKNVHGASYIGRQYTTSPLEGDDLNEEEGMRGHRGRNHHRPFRGDGGVWI
jgi:hypothetical protein